MFNHRVTEVTETIGAMNLSPVVLLVLSVTLWLTPVIAAQPPIVGRPIDFSGAIGGPFVVTMSVESATVAVEKPFTLTLRIVGPGNLKELVRPPLGKLAGFKPFAVDDLDDSFTEGPPPSRTFRYRLRARSTEAKQIPPFKFVYFNPIIVPASRGYQTTYAPAVELSIKSPPTSDRPDLAREIVELRRLLERNPYDSRSRALLFEVRTSVNYPASDMSPTEPSWSNESVLYRWGRMFAAWSMTLAIALLCWRRKRWSQYAFVTAVSLVAIGVVGVRMLLEWNEQTRNEVQPIVVVARDTALRRGNGEEYPPRITAPLPPGAEVRRLCERHGWLQVELANGVVGWLPADSVIQ